MSIEIRSFPRAEWRPVPIEGCRNVDVKGLPRLGSVHLAMLRFQPDGTIHEHSADVDVDVLCLEGAGITSVGDEQVAIKAGEWVHWPAELPHRLWTTDQSMMTLMVEHVGVHSIHDKDDGA